MRTKQEIYDIVINHLRAQGAKSLITKLDEEGNLIPDLCAYRGDGGMKCAAGILIPDDVYSEKMEGFSMPSSQALSPGMEGDTLMNPHTVWEEIVKGGSDG